MSGQIVFNRRTGFVSLGLALAVGLFALLAATYYVVAQDNTTGYICGNYVCDPGETSNTCPIDCGTTSTYVCGNYVCDPGETWMSCSTDCKCGNSYCDPGEDVSCPGDCTKVATYCGNGTCDSGETNATCPGDCLTTSICDRDGICEMGQGEIEATCPNDCSSSNQVVYCGNGVCESSETRTSCPTDCKCGNSYCDPGEDVSCPGDCQKTAICDNDGICEMGQGETMAICPSDCKCGNYVCDPNETNATCPNDCLTTSACDRDGVCEMGQGETNATCPNDCTTTQTTYYCGNYVCDPGETRMSCSTDCKCGNSYCDPGEDISCPGDCQKIQTPYCGNRVCDPGETTATCPGDCPIIQAYYCGNYICESGETATSCPVDCGQPPPTQACNKNGYCDMNQSETTATCPSDCPMRPVCGNTICEKDLGESSSTCPTDCGTLTSVCGNGLCEPAGGETAANCPKDCYSATTQYPTQPVFVPPEICRLKSLMTVEACKQFLQTAFFAQTGMPTPVPAVPTTTTGENKNLILPEWCTQQGITDPRACLEAMKARQPAPGTPTGTTTSAFLPLACQEKGLETPEECQQFFREKALLPECVQAGLTTPEQCKAFQAAKYLPEECRQAGVLDEAGCRQVVDISVLPQVCKDQQILDTIVCRQLIEKNYGRPEKCAGLADDVCWRMIETGTLGDTQYEARVGQVMLPEQCVREGITDITKCRSLMEADYVSEECRSAGIYKIDACDAYLYQRYQRQGTETMAAALPDECVTAGLTDAGACKAYLGSKYLPRECLKAGLTDGASCAKLMAMKRLSPECLQAGITDEAACRDYLAMKYVEPACAAQGITDPLACKEFLYDRLAGAVGCVGLSAEQCATSLKERHLAEVMEVQERLTTLEDLIQDELSGGGFVDVPAAPTGEEAAAPAEGGMAGYIPARPLAGRKFKLIGSAGGIAVDADDSVVSAPSAVVVYDTDGDGVPDDVEKRFGFDPLKPDTDGDGVGDLQELKMTARSAIDKALAEGKDLGQPKFEGEVDDKLTVEGLAVSAVEGGQNGPAAPESDSGTLVFSGTGVPGEIVTIYIYSDMPIVMTTEVDANGQWQYELDDPLQDGSHEIYVAVNDDSGKVVRKSSPLSFMIRGVSAMTLGEAVTSEAQAATAASVGIEEASQPALYTKLFILGGILLIVIAIGIAALVMTSRRRGGGGDLGGDLSAGAE